jgi:hypothetical protein
MSTETGELSRLILTWDSSRDGSHLTALSAALGRDRGAVTRGGECSGFADVKGGFVWMFCVIGGGDSVRRRFLGAESSKGAVSMKGRLAGGARGPSRVVVVELWTCGIAGA